MPQRDVFGYLQALGPLIAALVAVGVATMQYVLQRQSQKQDLFEKCFQIYRAADNFVFDTVRRSCKPDRESYSTFLHATDSAPFLFGTDVLEVLEWIRGETGRLATESDVPVDSHSEQTESQRLITGIMRGATFSIQWEKRKVAFWPYLQLHHSQRWYARLEEYMERITQANDRRLNSRYEKPSD